MGVVEGRWHLDVIACIAANEGGAESVSCVAGLVCLKSGAVEVVDFFAAWHGFMLQLASVKPPASMVHKVSKFKTKQGHSFI